MVCCIMWSCAVVCSLAVLCCVVWCGVVVCAAVCSAIFVVLCHVVLCCVFCGTVLCRAWFGGWCVEKLLSCVHPTTYHQVNLEDLQPGIQFTPVISGTRKPSHPEQYVTFYPLPLALISDCL